MRALLLALITAPAALATACTTAAPADTGQDGSAPLEVRHSSSGSVRLGAWIQIGDGAPFLALVDSGSSGLRVLPSAVDADAYTAITNELVSFSYHSGLALQGVVATGTVTIGGLATPQPIPIMRVRDVGCTAAVPDCDAAGASADDYQAFGYDAVLGIGMRNLDTSGGIGNPIAQLAGSPSYIVRGPDIGGSQAELQIAPPAAATAGFATVQLPAIADGVALPGGVPAWDDRQVPACVTDETHGVPFCAGALLDTGATSTQLESPSHTGADETMASGTRVAVQIGEASAPLTSYSFTVGATPVPGIDKVITETRTGGADDLINLGTAPFLRDDVWFDQLHGTVGIAPRAGAPITEVPGPKP